MGFSLVVLVLLAVFVGGIAWQKSLGTRISTPEHVDVDLPLDTIVAVAGRATRPLAARALGRGTVAAENDGREATWRVRSKGGVLVMRVRPVGGARGYRVTGWAEELTPAHYGTNTRSGVFALGFAITNRIYEALGVAHAPGVLIRQRRRAFQALARAEEE
ncbi:hypothetical protein ACIQU5_23465 [Streptomyces sp. NPDC090306]|uniref:hypothetical protein n=1 Tax=unclassified Streptomyces TaxID=2593676 RepID=UPI0036E9A423